MVERKIKIQPAPLGRDINVCDRANEGNGQRFWAEPLSWYLAQPARRQSKWVLTASGYMVLP